MTVSGLCFFIIFSLAFIGPAQTDETNCTLTTGIDQNVEVVPNKTEGHPPFFAIVNAIVLGFNGGFSIKVFSLDKINTMLGKVGSLFAFIPVVSRGFVVYKKWLDVNCGLRNPY